MVDPIEQAAAQVARARVERQVLTSLTGVAPDDIGAGYRIMRAANDRLVPHLGPVVGFKIGATTAHMRDYLGVAEPVFGEIFARSVQFLNGQVPFSAYRRLGIETEIAVVLKDELGPGRTHDRRSVAQAVETVHAAVELVEDRYDDFRTIGPATLAADNFFGVGLALGRSRPLPSVEALDRLTAVTSLEGEEIARGTSDALLGHPLDALAWLANCRAGLGLSVPAGSVVTLGSITPVVWLERPHTASIQIETLGKVDVYVEPA